MLNELFRYNFIPFKSYSTVTLILEKFELSKYVWFHFVSLSVYFSRNVFILGKALFNGISTDVGNLMPNPFNIYDF